ncbi:MAG: T9SS type A sorting domain-containing protein [Bacteroidota bacterium]|nr:T9SS type A sorting domain-containing protein [Bacteroidota bacterium]
MNKKITLLSFIFTLTVGMLNAQTRYADEIFSSVSVQEDLVYGANATILPIRQTGHAILRPLAFDFYSPEGDKETNRPLVVLWHTSGFVPHPINGAATGTRRDSSTVEMAKRWAKRGFVVAVPDYRMGWNPGAGTQPERAEQLIAAAYRAVQDAHTFLRFMSKTYSENNPYGIDTSKVFMMGQGAGSYIPINAALLRDTSDYIKIPTATDGKFLKDDGKGGFIPMIIEQVHGNVWGTNLTVIPNPGAPNGLDTLNYPNHADVKGLDFKMVVNLTGAVADSAWIDENTVPFVSFHSPTEGFSPYRTRIVVSSVNLGPIIPASGGYDIHTIMKRYGNNEIYQKENLDDELSKIANSKNDGLDGLYPMTGLGIMDSSPWDWWTDDSTQNPNIAKGYQDAPDASKERAMNYLYTIFGFVVPRFCIVLDLPCETSGKVNNYAQNNWIKVYPNPAHSEVVIDSRNELSSIQILDMNGKIVAMKKTAFTKSNRIAVAHLPKGVYMIQAIGKNFVSNQRIMIK